MAFYNWGLNLPILNSYVLRGIFGFFLGISFFEIYSKWKDLVRKKRIFVIIIEFAMLVFLYKDIRKDAYGAHMLITMIDLVAVPAIIIITDNMLWLQNIVENRIFKIIGSLSMEIYFFHWPIMTIFMWFWKKGEVTFKGYLAMIILIIIIVAILKVIILKIGSRIKKKGNQLEVQ